jgi:hypothetical protein
MRVVSRLSLLLGVLALAAAAPAVPDGPAVERDQNRRLVARYRTDPAHYERLKNDLRWFQSLPPERQAALRKLDQDLQKEDPVLQARLFRVMDRYATWLERLPEADRRRIEAAPTAAERLRIVKELRDKEWVARLPRAKQQELEQVAPDKRAELLESFRKQDRERRLEWERALAEGEERPQAGPPLHLADLPPGVRVYLANQLTAREQERLKDAEGQWPAFGQTLLELAAKHPVTIPGPADGPRRPKDLPPAVRDRLKELGALERKRLRAVEGRWPEYAIVVTRLVRARGQTMPVELGPCHADELPPAVKAYLDKKLLPALGPKEKQLLRAAEGYWPDYPRILVNLAQHHNLSVPGLLPPGPRNFWEKLRTAVADASRVPPS